MKKSEAIKIAKKSKDLFTGDSFELTEVVPGDRCNNGGEYGFYSGFAKTNVPGVYHWSRRTTSEFDLSGMGTQGFVVLTNAKVARLLSVSKRITDAAEAAWEKYQWGGGDYPRYTGDSCEDEVAAIIIER